MRTNLATVLFVIASTTLAADAVHAQQAVRGASHDAAIRLSFERAMPTIVEIVDRQSRLAARFEVPSGRTPSVRFVAGDNVVVSWGCGTECENTVLLRPDGTTIEVFDHLEMSPDGEIGAAYTPGTALQSRRLALVSLRTGRVLVDRADVDVWNTCRVTWNAERVFFQRCSRDTDSFGLPLPE